VSSSSTDETEKALAALASKGVMLDLTTHDLCFVAGLHLRAQQAGIYAFSDDQLIDIFEQVVTSLATSFAGMQMGTLAPQNRGSVLTASTSQSLSGPSKPRATAAIRKLRAQRVLLRVDAHGVARAGEYSLTRLGTAIAEFYLDEDVLTQASLGVLTRTLLASLCEVRQSAHADLPLPERHASIALPLRITASDLVSGIQKRQRGFDLQQEESAREMAELIASDWFAAVERCEQLLDSTSRTLSELSALLLKDGHEILSVLQDIQDACYQMSYDDGVSAASRVHEQVVKAAAWGSARQRAFGEHYEYVHRYLRDVVRIDPARTLLHRLREQLVANAKGASGQRPDEPVRSFALIVAQQAPCRVLREVLAKRTKPPVVRVRKPREQPPEVAVATDPEAHLQDRVRDALAQGTATLSEITRQLTFELDPASRFLEAGRVAEAVVRVRKPLARAERSWVVVADACELEEWELDQASALTASSEKAS
jgi:chromosome partition protein MukF